MKYDTIIIGGGLSGLMAGVKLASARKRVAIISSGQSALHFSSGSASLLNCINGQPVEKPIEAMAQLPESHPYRKIGIEKIAALASEAESLLNGAGLKVTGTADHARHRLTPLGLWEPTWLSFEDFASCDHKSLCPWKKVAIVNFKGYLDFHPEYLADGIRRSGMLAECHEINLPQLAHLRRSCSEMRAASIAKVLRGDALETLGAELIRIGATADVLLLPAVVGLKSNAETETLASLVNKPIRYVPVVPMSVIGVKSEFMLRRRFESLGGTYLLGDSVKSGDFSNGTLKSIRTVNLGETPLEADEFIIATGSFFSQGLVAKPDTVIEPVFGLDVDQTSERTERYNRNFFAPQPYMKFGLHTDSNFRVSRKSQTIANLRAIGAILSGADALKEGSGAGIAMLSALEVANIILSPNTGK